MRKISRILSVVAALLLAIAMAWQPNPAAVTAQETMPSDEHVRSITVAGFGEVEAEPDTAFVRFGVVTEAEQAEAALSQNSEQMQAVLDALVEADIAEADIQTEVVRLQPIFEEPEPQPQAGRSPEAEITGYRATNSVRVRADDLDNVGTLMDTAVSAGANQVLGISFEVSNPTELLRQAREQAWQDAMDKAEQLVELADAELGPALDINATDRGPIPLEQETFAAADAARVPVQPGTQTISVNLQVTWQLQ